VVEICRREEVAVIRHRYGGHSTPRGFGRQFADFAGSIEKGVVRVEMQMYEI